MNKNFPTNFKGSTHFQKSIQLKRQFSSIIVFASKKSSAYYTLCVSRTHQRIFAQKKVCVTNVTLICQLNWCASACVSSGIQPFFFSLYFLSSGLRQIHRSDEYLMSTLILHFDSEIAAKSRISSQFIQFQAKDEGNFDQ